MVKKNRFGIMMEVSNFTGQDPDMIKALIESQLARVAMKAENFTITFISTEEVEIK